VAIAAVEAGVDRDGRVRGRHERTCPGPRRGRDSRSRTESDHCASPAPFV